MSLLRFVATIILLVIGITLFTLIRNGANLLDEPGPAKRLGVFLTLHSASTSDDPFFEELRTPVFDMDAKILYQHVLEAGSELGWGVLAHDSDIYDVSFIVRSPVFLFEDDVYAQVVPLGEDRSALYIQSSSRSSGADFAANSGHIQTLISELKKD